MLRELVNYAKWLKDDFEELFEGTLTEGLHIGIEIQKNEGSEYEFTYRSKVYKKGDELDGFLMELRKREIISKALGGNKNINSTSGSFSSNNPYALFFYVEGGDENEIRNRLEFIFGESNEENGNKRNIIDYYNALEKDYKPEEYEKELIKAIKKYTCGNQNERSELKKRILQDLEAYNFRIKNIRINFLVNFKILEKAAKRYFAKRIFVKNQYNKEKNKKEYGLPSFFNKVAEKKVFNLHKTSFFKVNNLVEIDWAIILNEFLNAKENLPNPLPIFIDKDELNAKVVILFKQENKKNYKEIISDIVRNHKDDLGNYYLLNFTKEVINDLDFVSSFNFYLDDVYKITNLEIFNINIDDKIENIFDIEDKLDYNFLFKVNRNKGDQSGVLKSNYFTDDPGKGNEIPGFILNNLYKYRKTLYDAIYKSRLYLITPQMIKEICEPVIRYEISHDETNDKGDSKNEDRIIRKLLYYFALNKIFDKEHKNTGGIDMTSKLPEYYNNLKELLEKAFDLNKSDSLVFKSDEDFAFGLGQLIRYLLEQSESGNKNHSMLVPFLQKLNNYELFMKQLKTTFKTYSHKIKMNYWMFDRLMANVMSYKPKKGLQDLEMIILSGYFAESVIEKLIGEFNKENNNQQNNKIENKDKEE